MRRLHALGALALAALASPAYAAEITRVATAGEPGNAFDLDVGVRWDRWAETATITREGTNERLRFARTRNSVVPRVAVGLWNDLEAHLELPYVLGDDREWRYGTYLGTASGPSPGDRNTIAGNLLDANGNLSASPRPLFAVGSGGAAGYHGGRAGDLKAGLSWGIFDDRKDDTKPFWLVGTDLTFPTAARWEPGKGRSTSWDSPDADKKSPGPFGERVWRWDLYTVLSKRYAYADPYVRAHAQLAFKSSSTYSNCDAIAEATAPTLQTGPQMNTLGPGGQSNCAAWGSAAGAKLPFVAGITVGTELIPYEDPKVSQKLSVDLRVFSDVTTSQRFYNELTDATGKLLHTGGYLEMGALLGLYLRASQYVQFQARASLAMRTAHDLTGESLYKAGWPYQGQPVDPAQVNPNFDWRYDAPGRRFRISEVSIFELSIGGVVQF